MPPLLALVSPSDLAIRLGSTLRARRKALAISATAAAEAAQISRVTWHRLEKGELTVALGSFLASAQVLGMAVDLQVEEEPRPAGDLPLNAWLPLQIRLGDYPQLRALAWQVGDAAERLAPHEVLGLYERNWRHVRPDALEPRERALIEALRLAFGAEALRV